MRRAAPVIVVLLIIVAAYLWLTWWVIGVLLDWANAHFALQLAGTSLFVAHLVVWLLLASILSLGNRARS